MDGAATELPLNGSPWERDFLSFISCCSLLNALSKAGSNRSLVRVRQTRIPFRALSMLWPIFVTLLILWLAGMVVSYTLGGYIHVLLALAVIVLLAQVTARPEKRGPAEAHTAQRDDEEKQDKEKGAA